MGLNLAHDVWFTSACFQRWQGSPLEMWSLCLNAFSKGLVALLSEATGLVMLSARGLLLCWVSPSWVRISPRGMLLYWVSPSWDALSKGLLALLSELKLTCSQQGLVALLRVSPSWVRPSAKGCLLCWVRPHRETQITMKLIPDL